MAGTWKRIVGPALLTATAATQYTVASGQRIRRWHLHVDNVDATTAYKLTLSIGTDGTGTDLFKAYSIAAGDHIDRYFSIPLEAAEIIQAFADTTNKLNITIGAELEIL